MVPKPKNHGWGPAFDVQAHCANASPVNTRLFFVKKKCTQARRKLVHPPYSVNGIFQVGYIRRFSFDPEFFNEVNAPLVGR